MRVWAERSEARFGAVALVACLVAAIAVQEGTYASHTDFHESPASAGATTWEGDPLIPLPAECVGISFDGEVISGTEGHDQVVGTNKNDLILGLGGNDVLRGGNGDDCLVGGEGHDWLGARSHFDHDDLDHDGRLQGRNAKHDERRYDDHKSTSGPSFGPQYYDLDATTMGGGSHDTDELKENGQDVLLGGNGRDGLNGGNGTDLLHGGADQDFLDGRNGQDQLHGQSGWDLLIGGNGTDLLDGGVSVHGPGKDPEADLCIGGRGPEVYVECELIDGRRGDS